MERTRHSSDASNPESSQPQMSYQIETPARSFPSLDFHNPYPHPGTYGSASTFLPLHMEKAYAYPLVVWLGGHNKSEGRLSRVMPKISLRNYIGIAPDLGKAIDSQNAAGDFNEAVFECLDKACLHYNINSSRIFVAGAGPHGSHALSLAMTHSEYFAGAISLGGQLPDQTSLLGDLRTVRKTPIFLAQNREDHEYSESALCDNLKVLHVAGFSVTARQYPGCQSLMDQMLHDMDVWMMEIINGYDMTASERTTHEFN